MSPHRSLMSHRIRVAVAVAVVGLVGSPLARAAAVPLPEPVAAICAAAAQEDLPTAALETKALEGLAKGVPPERIATVLNGLVTDLRRASELLGPAAQGSDRADILLASVSARRAGVSDRAVRQLAELPEALRAQAVYSIADLVRQGFTEEESLQLVRDATGSGDPRAALTGLATSAAALLSQGVPQAAALDAVRASISTNGGASDPPAWGPGGKPGKTPPGQEKNNPPGQDKKN